MHPKRRGPVPKPPLERVLAHLALPGPHGCRLWTGAVLKRNGYGVFNRGQNTAVYAHRLVYAYLVGPIPPGKQINHTCSRFYAPGDITYRRCCEPTHLRLGTQRENIQQAMAEGRWRPPPRRVGQANNMATLTDAAVLEILQRAAAGETYAALGRHYGVRADTVSSVVRGLTWAHVKRPPEAG